MSTDGGDRTHVVRGYHADSMHNPGRYAAGPEYLDWRNQPDPFREYEGAPRIELPLASEDLSATWDELHRPGAFPPSPLDRARLGAFFELALGLTAWKQFQDSRWALRANPSSGNLHPTEGYALLPGAGELPAGIYHYLSREHLIERRFTPSAGSAERIAGLLGEDAFLLGLTSIHWREAWKYGVRAFRYCQHDVGHAIAAARYAAGVLGWTARLLPAPGDEDVAALLGLDRRGDPADIAADDREHPDILVLVGPPQGVDERAARLQAALDELVAAMRDGVWRGRPNPLSAEHVHWEPIEAVAAATRKPRGATRPTASGPQAGAPGVASSPERAARLIRRRRSAVDMDGETEVPAETFYRMLDRLLPHPGVPPWDAWPWPSCVHPLFFVHRVRGLAPGLYLLERDPGVGDSLPAQLRPTFAWSRPASCPETLPFYQLEEGDARGAARLASCGQAIASDSAFTVAMLAEMALLDEQPWAYRRLHWEAGVLGQVLYLEAEAAGVRGTGIGCFLDDVVHELVGLGSTLVRDVYHFTVGGPVDDPRLTTLPAYDDPVARR